MTVLQLEYFSWHSAWRRHDGRFAAAQHEGWHQWGRSQLHNSTATGHASVRAIPCTSRILQTTRELVFISVSTAHRTCKPEHGTILEPRAAMKKLKCRETFSVNIEPVSAEKQRPEWWILTVRRSLLWTRTCSVLPSRSMWIGKQDFFTSLLLLASMHLNAKRELPRILVCVDLWNQVCWSVLFRGRKWRGWKNTLKVFNLARFVTKLNPKNQNGLVLSKSSALDLSACFWDAFAAVKFNLSSRPHQERHLHTQQTHAQSHSSVWFNLRDIGRMDYLGKTTTLISREIRIVRLWITRDFVFSAFRKNWRESELNLTVLKNLRQIRFDLYFYF